jgi:hypothetical protein
VSATAPPRGAIWSPPDVCVKSWGEGEAVAYSGTNAKTHVISEAAAHILALAAGQGLEEDELTRLFWSDEAADDISTTEDRSLLRNTVDGLLGAGLLNRRA